MPTNIKKGNYESEVHNRNKLFFFIYVHHTNILSCMVIEPTTYSAKDSCYKNKTMPDLLHKILINQFSVRIGLNP